jgi:putative oxidoreductase
MNASTSEPLLQRTIRFFLDTPSVGSSATRATLAIRGAVGAVFIVSGLMKFLFENQGPGRFAKIGLPAAHELAYFVGSVEVACGALLLVGLFTRLAAIPLVIDMIVAVATTKVPLLFGPGPEPIAAMPKIGFWAFAYQARLDVTMLIACVYLVVIGAGVWSIDAIRASRSRRSSDRAPGDGARAMNDAPELVG